MPEKDTAKVRVIRKTRQMDEVVDGEPTGKKVLDPSSLVTAFSYIDPENPASTTTFIADASKDEFSLTPEQATAAIETGGFEVSPESKSKTKKSNKDDATA
jgi:nucleoid-associated protein YgaU